MLTSRSRLTLAGITITLTAFTIVLVAWGQPAQGTHIPDTGQVPSNCVEFQVNTLGTKSPSAFPAVGITVDSWDNGSESHTVVFTIAGLISGQYVDISAKSGTTVQESGPYGNGTHSFTNALQNAISHIRLCVFVQSTTTTLDETTTTGAGETTTTRAGETTTTASGGTTTTGATPTTVEDDVLGVVVTTSSVVTQSTVAGNQVVAGELPFTGLNAGNIGQLALALLLLGTLILTAVRSTSRTRSQDQD
ncbi:MAG TPA: hypothetical protein VLA91_11400 [Acidimicrobiia bacterium]|nr:hypothetical protein [Acidimicrobiia bacterium]